MRTDYALVQRPIPLAAVLPLGDHEAGRLSKLCVDLDAERSLVREEHRLAMHGHLALLAVEVVRSAANRGCRGAAAPGPADPTVEALRHLVDDHFRKERQLDFHAGALAIHEIAYDLAVSDPSHFARFFRKQTGLTPQAFRDQDGGWRTEARMAAAQSRRPAGAKGQPSSAITASACLKAWLAAGTPQ